MSARVDTATDYAAVIFILDRQKTEKACRRLKTQSSRVVSPLTKSFYSE